MGVTASQAWELVMGEGVAIPESPKVRAKGVEQTPIAAIPEQVTREGKPVSEAAEPYKPHRFAAAEDEVISYFTHGIGVKGQGYETGGGGRDPLDLLPVEKCQSGITRIGRIGETIDGLSPEHRATLVLIYGRGQHEFTWLEDDLRPHSGRGSFVWLAVRTARAQAAWRKAFPKDSRDPSPAIVLQWVTGLGRNASTSSRLGPWVNECESARSAALKAYGEARGLRTAKVREEREERRRAVEARGAAIIERGRIQKIEKEATRFELRVMRAALGVK